MPSLPGATSRPSSPPWPAQPTRASPVAFLLCQEDGHAPGARGHAPRPPPPCFGHLLPPCLPPLLPGDATRPPRTLSLSRISPSVPIPSALSLSRSTTSTREHRRAPPRPVSTPRLGDASRGTAAPSSSSPPTHVTPGALHRRPRRRSPPRPPELAAVRFAGSGPSPASSPPRMDPL